MCHMSVQRSYRASSVHVTYVSACAAQRHPASGYRDVQRYYSMGVGAAGWRLGKMPPTVDSLRAELRKRKLPTEGLKAELEHLEKLQTVGVWQASVYTVGRRRTVYFRTV